jgi:hypothetical protein
MRYSFRLAEVVGHVPDPRRRPGTIKNICEFTGLDRHQVASLLKNEIKYVPLDALSKLCEFLIDRSVPQDRPRDLALTEVTIGCLMNNTATRKGMRRFTTT